MRKSKSIRIGAFAQRFDVSIDTIRFYIANGLLIPERIHNQYSFDKNSIGDMEEILKLKNMRFTIQEMRFLTSLRRLRNLVHNNDLSIYRSLIHKKKQRLHEEMDTLRNSMIAIDEELKNISYNENHVSKMGVPIDFLKYMACPDCGKNLNLNKASIQNNSIYEGQLLCDCGYRIAISDGIIITDSAIEGNSGFLSDQEGVLRFIEKNNGYALLLERAVSWISNRLNCCNSKNDNRRVILEVGTGYGLFMNNYIDSIGNDIYIATELKISKVRELKQVIEGSGRSPNIVFVATNSTRAPIKKESVDIVVDLISSSYHIKKFKNCPVGKIGTYLKPGGIWVGCNSESDTPCHSADSKCLVETIHGKNQSKDTCSFLEYIIRTDLGSTVNESDYLYGLEKDSEVHMNAYMSRKK